MDYFSDREKGKQEQTNIEITELLWGGIYSLIQGRLEDHSFGHGFPDKCTDGFGPCGCDEKKFGFRLKAEIPSLQTPLTIETIPPTETIMDLLEFCAKKYWLAY